MTTKITMGLLIVCVAFTMYISMKLNARIIESSELTTREVSNISLKLDSMKSVNDSLSSLAQEQQITIGRYEYMIELLRQNLDSNKVDRIISNVE